MADWRDLPGDIIDSLGLMLSADLCDLVRLDAVCKPWKERLVLREWLGYAPTMQTLAALPSLCLPKLLLPNNEAFIECNTGEIFRVDMEEAHRMRFVGSGHGWLVTELNGQLGLYNPVTRRTQQLPGFTNSQGCPLDAHLSKAIIVRRPMADSEWTVAAISNGSSTLHWVRPGAHPAWTMANTASLFTDIAHSRGFLFVVNNNLSRVEAWSIILNRRVWIAAFGTPVHRIQGESVRFKSYVLEDRCEIIGVTRPAGGVHEQGNRPLAFFKLVLGRWVQLSDLGDCCLFLSDKASMALSPVPSNTTFLSNCIYFIEDAFFYRDAYSLDRRPYRRFSFVDSARYIRDFSALWVTFRAYTELAFK